MRVSHVGGEGSGMVIVNVAWISACVKPGLLDDPDHQDQQT